MGSGYTIERELGGGGMSRVFVAREVSLGRRVVLKALPPELALGVSVDRFRREIQVAAALQHPLIVPLLAAGQAGETLYYLMPFIEGESLRARLDREQALPVSDAIRLLRDVADALAYAHRHGVVHRDIKPANILLTEHHAVVADFGVSKAISLAATEGTLTASGFVLGTPLYMAPEQALGDPHIDHRADLYALGVMGYEMLTGCSPFQGANPQAVLAAQLTETPDPLLARRPSVPLPLAELVMRCLERNPADRPQSAEQVREQLEALPARSVESVGLVAHGVPTPEARAAGTSRTTGRSPTVRIRRALAFLLVLGLLAYGLVRAFGVRRADRGAETDTHSAAQPSRTIAVLPFANLSPDPENEYFTDGMTEELINALAKIEGLRVVARTSAFEFKGKSVDVREIGGKLNVGAVVEGSVRRSGERLRVTAQLINVADGYHLWSEAYERPLKDVFAVQDEISRAIADALRLELVPRGQPVRRPTGDLLAYDFYLQGRSFWNRRTAADLLRAIKYFIRAIEQDSGFALAHAGLADAYAILPDWTDVRTADAYSQARAAATQALRLDSTLAEAHTTVAYLLMVQDWDWKGSEDAYRRAIRLNPSYPTAHQWYSELLVLLGRLDDAENEIRRAHELDPLSLVIDTFQGYIPYLRGRRDEAILHWRRVLALEPDFALAHLFLGMALLGERRPGEAVSEIETATALDGRLSGDLAILMQGYVAAGKRERARAILEELRSRSQQAYVPPVTFALAYTALGERDSAFAWLKSAVEVRDPGLVHLLGDPIFDRLRPDPRFTELIKRMDLPS